MSKPTGYRYGSWLILHGGGAHLVGFSTTCWLSREGHGSLGLWSMCKESQCHNLSAREVPGWLEAARVLSCVSVFLLASWLVVGCQCQCIKTRQHRYRWLMRLEEVLAITSGCTALLSVGIFAVAAGRDSTFTEFSLSWSLWLVVGGASACTVGGLIVAGTRNPAHPAPKPSTRSVRPSNMPTLGAGGVQDQGQTDGQDARTTRREQRRSGESTDIFNVISFNRCPPRQGGAANSNPGRAETVTVAVPPPPPYSVHAPPPGHWRDCSGQWDMSTQVYEISLSPPPSYEYAMNERPPPYEPRPPYPEDQRPPATQP